MKKLLKYTRLSRLEDQCTLDQWFSKWVELPPRGRFWGARGQIKWGGDREAKQRKGGENSQPLMDH